jgi:hypothetical protein
VQCTSQQENVIDTVRIIEGKVYGYIWYNTPVNDIVERQVKWLERLRLERLTTRKK